MINALTRFSFIQEAALAVFGMLVIFGIAEFIVAIVGASLTCRGVCYTPPARHTVVRLAKVHVCHIKCTLQWSSSL